VARKLSGEIYRGALITGIVLVLRLDTVLKHWKCSKYCSTICVTGLFTLHSNVAVQFPYSILEERLTSRSHLNSANTVTVVLHYSFVI
jgi:hypothetical protein